MGRKRPGGLPHEAFLQGRFAFALRAAHHETGQAQACLSDVSDPDTQSEDNSGEGFACFVDVALAVQPAQLRAKEGGQVTGDRANAILTTGGELTFLNHALAPAGEQVRGASAPVV